MSRSTSVQITLPIEAERFNTLGVFLNQRYGGQRWKIKEVSIEHVEGRVVLTLLLPGDWTEDDAGEFAELLFERLVHGGVVILSEAESPRAQQARSLQTQRMVEALLGSLLGIVGADGVLEDECQCRAGLRDNQSVCTICWARNVYYVYQWAQAHLA
jgi:hypothetical protein